MNATETRVPVGNTSLYARAIGQGPPVIVLHGGPDFDCGYLFPDVDRLEDGYRLIYYDQRGRGKSAPGVRPEDVTLASDVADLDAVRKHFQLDRPALLGHSWGAVLALEYALRQPDSVSRLILVSPAPASASDRAVLRKDYVEKLGADMDRQREIVAGAAYRAGDPEAVAARYRIHFEHALERPSNHALDRRHLHRPRRQPARLSAHGSSSTAGRSSSERSPARPDPRRAPRALRRRRR